MPELPEVETIARGLKPLAGRVIAKVQVLDPISTPQGAAAFCRRLAGAAIRDVRRRAKLLLLDLDGPRGPLVLAVHLRMTGGLTAGLDTDEARRFCRVRFELEDGGFFVFTDIRRFGSCQALTLPELAAWPFYAGLGPEPLELDAAAFAALFQGRNAAIKAALLDQKTLAGVGNIYADESLFRAGIRPQAKAGSLSLSRLQGLHRHLQEVLGQAIRENGSSIRDYRDAGGNAGAFQNSFQAYGRAGEACVRCGATLRGTRVGGRSTTYCPRCQK
jgi:formamidopyrimidine-DNA glycosylase